MINKKIDANPGARMHEYDVATAAVQAALDAGAQYADVRVMHRRSESMLARNGEIQNLAQSEDAGLGVRALVNGAWGFAALPDIDATGAQKAGHQAAETAKASARVAGHPAKLVDTGQPAVARWEGACAEDPFAVPLNEKAELLREITATMTEHGADLAEASYQVWDTRKWFVSSEGHRIDQRTREAGAAMNATSMGETESQRRSFPTATGQYAIGGWEIIRAMDLPGHAARIAEESRALLTAPPCPAEETTLILGSDQMALQIHESVGHAVELDRILGWEAAFAGTSWLDPRHLGTLKFGSELMTITADSTLPGSLGSFGYDDEGTPASSVDIVRDGIWTGVLAGRDSATVAGLDYAGAVRSDGYAGLPMVRMTNVGLLPGQSTLDEMIAATDRGVLMESNRSWSIDDRRLNFQFGCEIGWEIIDGKRGRMLRNPTYTGISPRFWGSLDMLGNESEWVFHGLPNCGKGQPGQVGHTGHPAVPGRFTNVRVGVTG